MCLPYCEEQTCELMGYGSPNEEECGGSGAGGRLHALTISCILASRKNGAEARPLNCRNPVCTGRA